MARRFALSLIALAFATIASAQTSFSGAGLAAATAARDAFRTAIGGGTVAGANGSFGGVRREINWDGVPAASAAPNLLPANFFNTTSPRGVVFSTAGTGFQVSGASTDAGAGQPAAANFGNINATYTATFVQFSPQRLFTALGNPVLDVRFFVPGTTTPALTNAFGAIFTDVDNASTSAIVFFDQFGNSLGTFTVPTANNDVSFLGVTFPSAVVGAVRIINGNAALGPNDNPGTTDVVVDDDFIYGEPVAIAACTITCPGNIVVGNDTNSCGAVVNYAPTPAGSCGTITASTPSGSVFPVGVTTVTLTTQAGPSCSFTVTVNDTQPPQLSCPANITTVATSPSGAAVTFATPGVSDNCPAPAPANCDHVSGSTFAIGTTTVTCVATDAALNSGSCQFSVTVTSPAAAPTLSEWMLLALGAMLAVLGVTGLRMM